MTTPRGDLLLHPVRLRIVQALVNRPMTPSALGDALGDVAPATLYRHLNQLEDGGLIAIRAERRVRGSVERTFEVVTEAVSLVDADLDGANADDHFRYFATFVGTLLSDFVAYLDHCSLDGLDLASDRVGYRQVALWMTDDEFDELIGELSAAVAARIEQGPEGGRRRRLLSTIVMPDDRDPGRS